MEGSADSSGAEPVCATSCDEPGVDGSSAQCYGSRRGPGETAELAAVGATADREEMSDAFQLSHEFYDAYKAYGSLLKAEAVSPEQGDLDELSGRLKVIASHVVKLRLFSPNEELDDISTTDLKFMLVPYLLAEVTAATRDMELRLGQLRRALVYWRAFANDCQRLGVAHNADFLAIDRDPEDALDPVGKREEKIERYKRSKELDEKVGYLFKKKREALGDELQWGSGGAFDEDMERELILALLARAVAGSADSIASAEQELPLLEIMKERGGPGKGKKREQPPPSETPFILKIQDKAALMQLYKEMVFQCPFEQPTISLAECADFEMAQAQAQQRVKHEHDRRVQADDDDRWWGGDRVGAREDAEAEQKVYKDRDWDDWKDEHPYGSGNRMANLG